MPLPQSVAQLGMIAGNEQIGMVGMPLPDSIVVRAVDAAGESVAGTMVSFTVTAGGGTVAPAQVATDAAGYARASWTLGTSAGEQTLRATVPDAAIDALAFRAEATAELATATPDSTIVAAARFIHDEIAAGRSLATTLEPLWNSLGIRVLDSDTEADRLESLLSAGAPVLLDRQIAALDRAYGEGVHVSLTSFVAALAELGATIDGAPITTDALTTALAPVATMAEHDPATVLPALVLALGRERAGRSAAGVVDPVWGDAWLDPLQVTLLMYATHYSAGEASGATSRGVTSVPSRAITPAAAAYTAGAVAANPLAEIGRGALTGWVGGKVEMPLTLPHAASGSLCTSLVLYGYSNVVTVAPPLVHRAPETPNVSAVSAQLSFMDEYPFIVKDVLDDFGCTLPEKGTAAGAGKSLSWSLSGELPAHGALDLVDPTTNADGRATASYRTRTATLSELLRVVQSDATGTVDVRTSGLVEGWSALEASVGLGIWNPLDVGGRIFVRHYLRPRTLRITYRVAVTTTAGAGVSTSTSVVGGSGDLILQPDSTTYLGSVSANYESATMAPIGDECQLHTVSGNFTLDLRAPAEANTFFIGWHIEDPAAAPHERLLCNDTPPIDRYHFINAIPFMYSANPVMDGWTRSGTTLQADTSFTRTVEDIVIMADTRFTIEVIP